MFLSTLKKIVRDICWVSSMDAIVHFEIPADNIERAKKFYSSIFGWDIQKFPMPEGSPDYYGVCTTEVDKKRMPIKPGAINGGMMKRSHKSETPVLVINVKSVDAYVKKIEKAGGKVVMPKMSIADMGFYARIADTESNVIGLWEDVKK